MSALPNPLLQVLKTLAKPSTALNVAGVAAPILAGPTAALADQYVKPLLGRKNREQKALEQALLLPTPMQQQARMMRMQETMAFNQQMLATKFPELYAKLMAGRNLPIGATVIGGRPKIENVEAAARAMMNGAFGPPPNSPMAGIIGP